MKTRKRFYWNNDWDTTAFRWLDIEISQDKFCVQADKGEFYLDIVMMIFGVGFNYRITRKLK